MAAMSRGEVAKPRSKAKQLRAPKRVKGGTESTRNHTWKGFSQRIAQLKIEPVRRGRSAIIDDAELDATFSYFRDAFLEWRELNLSEAFTSFARKAAPLCDSLPQVLHHSDRIFDLLIEFIEKGEKYSEEPLLSLMAHLAHDLGEKFEKFFERAVTTVSKLAATHAEVEVIEWSFACLAWLFKYLSRLLVPDLRPVFNLMSPLLGKAHQKTFVSRFAAEALSFLVRKAGAGYHRDKQPLSLIIKHISQQLQEQQESAKDYEFEQGLMYLLADSLKGVQCGFHSGAGAILQELMAETYSKEHIELRSPPLEFVLRGVLTASIHHTDADNFQPLLDIVLSQIETTCTDARYTALSSRFLLMICGIRHGSRIGNWKPILLIVSQLLKTLSTSEEPSSVDIWEFLSGVAVIFQYCALDAAIPNEKLFDELTRGIWEPYFLAFCNLFADVGVDRFQTLLLPYFKRFVIQKAHEHGPELCAVLPRLYRSGSLPVDSLQPSEKWQISYRTCFKKLAEQHRDCSDDLVHYCNALLDMASTLTMTAAQQTDIRASLAKLLQRSLHDRETVSVSRIHTFAIGHGLRHLVSLDKTAKDLLTAWPQLCTMSSEFGHMPMFWHGIDDLLRSNTSSLDKSGPHMENLQIALMRCLGSPSHKLRLVAINIIKMLAAQKEDVQNIFHIAMLIEQTPPNLENQRSIAMRVGQIAKQYATLCTDNWVGEAIPTFCFGLLHVRLASVWDDSCSALKTICNSKEGEAVVTKIAFEWLNNVDVHETSPESIEPSPPPKRYVSEFECTNVLQLQEHSTRIQAEIGDSKEQLQVMFEHEHDQVPFHNPFSRTQALRVLNSMPNLAEKRSRLLVPVLLDWALDQPAPTSSDDDTMENTAIEVQPRWARKDQKSMLSMFANFNNPKVLYRADEVKAALLVLLSNGDVEIQKAALKALLTWREPALIAYQEQLLNLLDDARFRDELPIFLSEGKLQEQDVAQVLPVMLRLLYGKVIAGRKGLESKRKAVFMGLKNRFGDDCIRQFLRIAFGPLAQFSIMKDNELDEDLLQTDVVDTRKQFGMLNLLDDLLATFQSTFTPFTAVVIEPVLYCAVRASRKLSATIEADTEKAKTLQMSLLKNVRQRALHILAKLFESSPQFEWSMYGQTIVTELVEPRLSQLPIETAQSVSGLLRLFASWSSSVHTASLLVRYDKDVLTKIIECLGTASAKDEVLCFILDSILRRAIGLVDAEPSMDAIEFKLLTNRIHSDILQPYSVAILSYVGGLLRQSPSKDVLESAVQTVADFAPHIVGSIESRRMIEIGTFLLRQPSKRVNPKTKLGLLKILHEFVQRCDEQTLMELFDTVYDAICPMFAFVQDRTARALLCDVVEDLAMHKDVLEMSASLSRDLNSFAAGRVDEPDFERRSNAYNVINEQKYRTLSLQQWMPLLYNMLFFIKDNEELSIRVNASLTLRRFVEVADTEEMKEFVLTAILPGIQNGMKESSELVRVEFLAVLERLVQLRKDWNSIADLHVLLSDDDEASFFSNILHIQGHRRLRALRRLAAHASTLRGFNFYHILLPLLEHFVFNKAADEGADSLLGETIKTLTTLTETLEWPQLRSLLKRYIGYLSSKEDMQKPVIRLIAGLMDGLNRSGRSKGYVKASDLHSNNADVTEDVDMADITNRGQPLSTLAKTLPQQQKLASDLITGFLPDLTAFLHKKDDATVSLRVPIAVAIAKVLLLLPPSEIETRLPAVLLDICYILKSRAQEARDMSRNTLSEIAMLMGPNYLGFILKALRTALQRGYQLHVLSFTLHHILVKLSDQMQPGDLDYCLQDIVDCIMDDTFGITGQEKDADEYISKMKEVKSSKSFDSMDIIARSATPSHIIKLVLPIKSLLIEKLNARMVQKIDELFRRIALGILQNPTVNNRDILVFCYELIQEVYSASNSTEKKAKIDPKNKRYLVNNRGAAKSGARLSTSSYLYKMIRFSLDILRTVLRKHDNLQTPQNLAGFLPVIGDSMVQGQEEVQVAAVRLLTTIIKVPMSEMDTNCPVYIDEAMRAIKGALASNTELSQASLKLVSAVLRERPHVEVKERDIGHLLKRMLPDLDEPDRSGVSFGFLKAVMNRRIEVPEMYEAMDKVSEMMITNQTKSARDIARSHYFQFLTSYSQSEKRFKKQIEFLLKNLRYEHFEGRQSVMEALDLIISKALPRFADQAQHEYHGMIFLPLVHTLANDDSSKCREMASLLLKRLFSHASERRLASFAADIKSWLEQDDNIGLRRLGIQCFGFYFEAMDEEEEDLKLVQYVLDQLDMIIDRCLARRDEDDWELLYYSLTLLAKVCKKYPETMFSSRKTSLWTAIEVGASYPHAWVKLKAAELLGSYFAHLGVSNKDSGLGALPLEGSGGLQLAEQNMTQLCNAFLRNLLNPDVTEQLCMQSIKNIAFLARCLAVNGARWQWQKSDDAEEEQGELEEQRHTESNPGDTDPDVESDGFSSEPEKITRAEEKAADAPPTAIHRLMIRLSGIVRKDKTSMNAKSAIMSLLDTIAAKFPLEPFSTCLPHLLGTLNTLVDPATTVPRAYTQASTLNEPDDAYKSLIDKAREIMSTLQKRLGTQKYLKIMSEVQKIVRDRREERRRKRKVEAVADPEKWGKEKKRRNDIKKVKRKEKGMEHRGKRRGW